MSNFDLEPKTTYTRDEAISVMLGMGVERYAPPPYEATPEEVDVCEAMSFCVRSHLNNEYEDARSDYFEAKYDNLPADVVAQKLADLDRIKWQKANYEEYARIFDDEIAQADPKVRLLHTDKYAVKHYTVNSVRQWIADNNYGSAISAQYARPSVDTKSDIAIQESSTQQKLLAQEKAILAGISNLGHDPKKLPKNISGKPGVKANVRRSLKDDELFDGSTIFEHAWERLRKCGDVANVK